MTEKAVSGTYSGVNIIPGGHRQLVRQDCWGIMKKGLLCTEYNNAGEELIEGISFHEGYDKVLARLNDLSKETGFPIGETALKP